MKVFTIKEDYNRVFIIYRKLVKDVVCHFECWSYVKSWEHLYLFLVVLIRNRIFPLGRTLPRSNSVVEHRYLTISYIYIYSVKIKINFIDDFLRHNSAMFCNITKHY